MRKLLMMACMAALISGCSTVERTSSGIVSKFDVVGPGGQATETVLIRNNGWTLLYFIPGFYGDVTWRTNAKSGKGDIDGGVVLLQDKSNVSDCYETLQKLTIKT